MIAQQPVNELSIEPIILKNAALVFRAVNHKLRQKILFLLHQNKTLTVTEIYTQLKLEQSDASQQLAILRSANVITKTRDGKYSHYSINYKRLKEIQEKAIKLTSH